MCNFNGTNQKNCSCERIAGAVPVPVVVVVIAGPAGLGAAATPCGCKFYSVKSGVNVREIFRL